MEWFSWAVFPALILSTFASTARRSPGAVFVGCFCRTNVVETNSERHHCWRCRRCHRRRRHCSVNARNRDELDNCYVKYMWHPPSTRNKRRALAFTHITLCFMWVYHSRRIVAQTLFGVARQEVRRCCGYEYRWAGRCRRRGGAPRTSVGDLFAIAVGKLLFVCSTGFSSWLLADASRL